MVTRVRRARGFSLLELMVASLVALIILAGALAVLIQGGVLRHRQRELGDMNRDAARVMSQLSSELRQAGLGRPRGPRFVNTTTNAELFPPTFLTATPTQVTFLVDLPRPNSNFNGISYLADHQPLETDPADTNRLAILNELNGDCDVSNLPPSQRCATTDRSTILPSTGGTSGTINPDCSGTPNNSPSCPWGLNKYQASEFILLVDAAGRWMERQLDSPVHKPNGLMTRQCLALTSGIDPEFVKGIANRAYISTPDRVFYRLQPDGTGLVRLERKQCWGRLATSASDPAITTASASVECSTAAEGTGWEVLVRALPALDGLSFIYRDGNGTNLATDLASSTASVRDRALRSIRRVDISLKLVRKPRGSAQVEHTPVISVNVRQ